MNKEELKKLKEIYRQTYKKDRKVIFSKELGTNFTIQSLMNRGLIAKCGGISTIVSRCDFGTRHKMIVYDSLILTKEGREEYQASTNFLQKLWFGF